MFFFSLPEGRVTPHLGLTEHLQMNLSIPLLQGTAYGLGKCFFDTFVKSSAGWWAVTVAALPAA